MKISTILFISVWVVSTVIVIFVPGADKAVIDISHSVVEYLLSLDN